MVVTVIANVDGMTLRLTVQAHSACAVARGEAKLVRTTQTIKTAHSATPIAILLTLLTAHI